jgi:hypothetical protein
MKRVCLASILALVALTAALWQPASVHSGGTATLKGQIVWEGELPKRVPLDLKDSKDAEHCLTMGQPPLSEDWVVNADNKGIRWTFVWLAPQEGGTLPAAPAKDGKVEMDQPACMFVPHAVAMREGQTLIAKNSSKIAHNFKWTGNPFTNPGGNVLIPPGADHPIEGLRADRLPVIVQCNIHPWMKGWVRVFNHPYYAVTDANGMFEIKDAPTGNYNLIVWHGTGGWRGGAAGKNGTPITIRSGENDLGKLGFAVK